LRQGLADPADGGRLKVSFEVIYGHAFKPAPRFAAKPQTNIDLESLRQAAKATRRDPAQ
jgi:malonyl-CoA O-methyltransferase